MSFDTWKEGTDSSSYTAKEDEGGHDAAYCVANTKGPLFDFDSDDQLSTKHNAGNSENIEANKVAKKQRENRKGNKIKEIWTTFTMETSCHGLKIVGNSNMSTTARVLYGLLVALLICSLITTVFEMMNATLEHRTVIRTEVYVDLNQTFPSLTFCNMCPFNFRNKNDSDILYRLLARDSIFKVQDLHTNRDSIKQFLNRTVEDIFNEYSMGLGLVYATYEGISLNEDHFQILDTIYGRCYQFNSPMYVAEHGAFRSNVVRRTSGLRMLLNIQQDDYGIYEHGTAGIKVFINDVKDFPEVYRSGIEIMPGTSTQMSIKTNKVSFLPSPYKSYGSEPCIRVDQRSPVLIEKMMNYSFYNVEMCRDQCVTYKASMACSCYVHSLVIPHLRPCTTIEFIAGCFKNNSDRIILNIATECDCPKPCTATTYDVVLSSSQFPSKVSLNASRTFFNESDITKIRDNYLEVRVYFSSPLVKLETHEPEFRVDQLLGSLGGQFGLCLGASIITLVEVLDAVVCTVYVCIKQFTFCLFSRC